MALTKTSNQVIQTPYRKNFITNGNHCISQRGTSFPSLNGTAYTIDRWQYGHANNGSVSVYQDTLSDPTLFSPKYTPPFTLKMNVATTDVSIAEGQYSLMMYRIEGYDYRHLFGQTTTLSFFVYGTKPGTYCVSFRNSDNGRSYVAEYAINQANTWEFKTITLTVNPSGGNEHFYNEKGLTISWALACGSTYHTTQGGWRNGSYLATANQVNFLDAAASIYLASVQLELGPTATSFEYKSFSEELAACQRYYEKSYNIDIQPGTISALGQQAWLSNYTAQGCYCDGVTFTVCKRATPIMVFYSTGTGTANRLRNSSAAADITVTGSTAAGMHGYQGPIPTSESMSNGHLYNWQWTAEAEL